MFERLIDFMPLPPVEEDGSVAEAPALEFTKVSCCTLLKGSFMFDVVFSKFLFYFGSFVNISW